MRIVNWVFENVKITMIDIEGELYCTSKAVCKALDIKESSLRDVYCRHKDEFFGLSVSKCDANELRNFKKALDIKRLSSDMRLWTEDDFLTFAFMVKGERAKTARHDFRQFIKKHAKISLVSQEQYKRDIQELKREMQEMFDKIKTFSHGAKSTVGRMNNLGTRVNNLIKVDFGTERRASCQ